MSSRLRAVLMTGGERRERDDMSSSTNGGSAQAVAEKVGEETGLNAISKHSRRKGSKSVVVAIGPAVASATVRSARIMRRIAHVTDGVPVAVVAAAALRAGLALLGARLTPCWGEGPDLRQVHCS